MTRIIRPTVGRSSQEHGVAVASRGPRVTALAVAGFAIVGAVSFIVVNAVVGDIDWIDALTLTAAFTASALVGSVILAGRPGHRVGWLFVGIFVVGLMSGILGAISDGTRDPIMVVLGNLAWWPAMFLLLVFLPLWFPTGAPPSRRWAWVAWLGSIALVGIVALDLLQEQVCMDMADGESELRTETGDTSAFGACLEWAANPLGISGVKGAEEGGPGDVFFVGMLISMVSALASVVVRYRRSRLAERLQLKWFLYSIGLLISWALIGDALLIDVLGSEDVLFGDAVGSVIFGTALTALPVSAGVAITRYRLYEIDRIINRTVVYALVAGLLALLFVAGTVGVPAVLPFGSNDVAVAGTTLAAFFLFQPLRRRVQRIVDRRFYRTRYAAEQVTDDLSTRLRDLVDPHSVGAEWVAATIRTLQPVTSGIWIRGPS